MILTLPLFSQLILANHLVPAKDFEDSGTLCYALLPTAETRALIRFIIKDITIHFMACSAHEVEQLTRHWRAQLAPEMDDQQAVELFKEDDLNDTDSDAPVIRTVNHLFERALDLRASDIHFEPEANGLSVRCRVDGIMTTIKTLPLVHQPTITSRLKLMAKLDIGEKRLPQDGRIEHSIGDRILDLRVSTLPGVHGESVVLRILDRDDIHVSLEQLGMPAKLLSAYQQLITQANGMILVTGPTGSGKTTTLYASLEKINSRKQKIITVEDPVEYQLEGVTQIQTNAKIGLSFSSGLRSIVRQDPDIIMIGEIRDSETAAIAIESALTGHLIFSTLHTNNAAGTIARLQDMGVESYLLSSSLLAIQAQRLVRKICSHCRYETALTDIEAKLLDVSQHDMPKVYHGRGCTHCGETGYQGRVGLYELLVITDAIRDLIGRGVDTNKIQQQAVLEGMQTLRSDALEKLAQGVTSPEEVVRVTTNK
jgi:general secretion pathway protein E